MCLNAINCAAQPLILFLRTSREINKRIFTENGSTRPTTRVNVVKSVLKNEIASNTRICATAHSFRIDSQSAIKGIYTGRVKFLTTNSGVTRSITVKMLQALNDRMNLNRSHVRFFTKIIVSTCRHQTKHPKRHSRPCLKAYTGAFRWSTRKSAGLRKILIQYEFRFFISSHSSADHEAENGTRTNRAKIGHRRSTCPATETEYLTMLLQRYHT